MMAIFFDYIEGIMEVFNDFSVYGPSFDGFLANLEKVLRWSKDKNLLHI